MNTILFLNPPISMEERYGKLAPAGAVQPPLGLISLAGVMRDAGWNARVLDAEALRLNKQLTVEKILSSPPDLLGCTSSTLSIERTAAVASDVKRECPHTKIIIGGVHLTSQPRETMQMCPSFDYGVIGEGEQTLLELAEALSEDGDVSGVPGVIARSGDFLRLSSPRSYIEDLDTLPLPAWDLLPTMSRYYFQHAQSVLQMPSTSIVTSRGCTGRCIFCDKSVFQNACRAHSAEYVINMIRTLYHQFGIREIHFSDDNFMLYRKRLQQLAELLVKEELHLTWSCLARADMMSNRQILALMRKAGCWQITFGIESGCQEILDFERKGITLEQMENAVHLARECGLKTKGFLMIGHPGETPETIMRTIEFVNRLPMEDISITYFTVFPGAPLWPEAHKYGRVIKDFSRMSVFEPAFIPNGFTVESLQRYYGLVLRKFYLRPRVIFAYLRRMRSLKQIWALSKGAWAFAKSALFAGGGDRP